MTDHSIAQRRAQDANEVVARHKGIGVTALFEERTNKMSGDKMQ